MDAWSEKQVSRLMAVMVPLSLLLAGCSTTVTKAPPEPDHVVVGAGTSDDRKVIEKSDEQIYQTEHATTPTPSVPSSTLGVP
jgi:uncharacterized protein YceK